MHFFWCFFRRQFVSWSRLVQGQDLGVRTQDSGGGRGPLKIPKILLSSDRLTRVIRNLTVHVY